MFPIEGCRGNRFFFDLVKPFGLAGLPFTLRGSVLQGVQMAVRAFVFETKWMGVRWVSPAEAAWFVYQGWPFHVGKGGL